MAIKLTSMRFDLFIFTGSTQKGKLVAQSAGKNLVPCILELGGKSPCIIDKTCDANFAAKKALIAKTANMGQVCIAPDYLLVHESKVEGFVAGVKDYMATRMNNMDNPTEAGSGKVLNPFHYNRLCDMLNPEDLGPNHKFLMGNPHCYQDRLLKPCLITGINKDAQVFKEEIFGPIWPMIVYKDLDEAINYINREQEKPLVVYFFGARDGANKRRFENETSSGAFVTNDCIM